MRSLPMLQGEGAHPPADACDFARFCSGARLLEHQRPRRGRSRRSTGRRPRRRSASATPSPAIRRTPTSSRSSAGSGRRSGRRPRTTTATRTSSSATPTTTRCRRARSARSAPQLRRRAAPAGRRCWQRLPASRCSTGRTASATSTSATYQAELRDVPTVPDGRRHAQAARRLPRVGADAARSCSRSSSQWGFDTLVIPHGTTWGLYTPPGSTWDKQLTAAQHDPEKQTPDRGLLRPRQLRGVPRLARGALRRRRQADLPGADAPTTCRAAGGPARSSARAAATRRPTECERARRRRRGRTTSTAGVAGHLTVPGATRRGLARLRPVPRLLQAGLQLPARQLGAVQRWRSATSTTRTHAAPLPLRLHRLERQPHARVPAPATRSTRGTQDDRGGRAARRGLARAHARGTPAEATPRVGAVRSRRTARRAGLPAASTSSARRRSS